MRKYRVDRGDPDIWRDVLSRELVGGTLDGARLQFWAAAHDLEKAIGLRWLKLWAIRKFRSQNAEL